ncbi:MAG TPA: FHA domain-containing protein, partial [Labilithrix sp.]|nr:FHA domain-containing protein [Labilithrix sp.]
LWPVVVVVEGPGIGAELALREERAFVIGRTHDSDLVIDDVEISRKHVEIHRLANDILVADQHSSGGTWLGRSRLDPGRRARWPSTRMLRIGSSVLALIPPTSTCEAAPDADLEAPSAGPGVAAPEAAPATTPPDEHATAASTEAAPVSGGPTDRAEAPTEANAYPAPRAPRANPQGRIVFVAVSLLLVALLVAALGCFSYLVFG